ncbi:MAG TPA: tRNA (adenine(22)-N(1))-methyltransferase TrmK, partial [Bacillota bacterium]|nr:tRNA (adenine(22)-N(1))-methyltransferase TrmK [Bacillota bacterium]
ALAAEKLVREGERFYEIMVARRGRQEIDDPLLFELGPCLVRRKDPLLEPFIRQKIEHCRAITAALQKSGRPENRIKYEYYLQKELRLKEVLHNVGHSENRSRLS